VLIEDVGEEIDPGLDSVLTKSIYKDEGLEKINFADRALIYDNRFKLFLTTKLPNPHFLPEICIKLTIINFTVTFDGLEEQLLVDVVKNE
jgi:dynein heavy chain